jgi:hypothetical protein
MNRGVGGLRCRNQRLSCLTFREQQPHPKAPTIGMFYQGPKVMFGPTHTIGFGCIE